MNLKLIILIGGFMNLLHSTPHNALKAEYIGTNWWTEMEECRGKYDTETDSTIYGKEPIILKKIYSNGSLHMTVPCLKDKLEGVEKTYSKKGKLIREVNYIKDIPNGWNIEYYGNGQIKQKIFLKDGFYDGEKIYYFKDGTIKGNCFYKKGLQEGRCYMMEYNLENKKEIRFDVSYKNGLREDLAIESQGAIFTGFTSIYYYEKDQISNKLSIFRRSKYHLNIRINHKKIKDKKHEIEKCIFSWYKKRSELLLDKGSSFMQKNLKNECFSDITL